MCCASGKKAIGIIILDIFNFPFAYRRRFRLPYIRTLCRKDTHKVYNRYPGLGERKLTSRLSVGGRFMDFCALCTRRTENYPIVNIPYTGSINLRKQPSPFRRAQWMENIEYWRTASDFYPFYLCCYGT